MAVQQPTPVLPAVGRLLWMLLGPIALVLLFMAIINDPTGWFTLADLLFFVALGLMLLGRWLEFSGGSPQTATGEPATAADLQRFLFGTAVIGVIVWVLANLTGLYLLS